MYAKLAFVVQRTDSIQAGERHLFLWIFLIVTGPRWPPFYPPLLPLKVVQPAATTTKNSINTHPHQWEGGHTDTAAIVA